MKLSVCIVGVLLSGSFTLASASSQGGAEWKFLQFETVEGETVSVRILDNSSVSIDLKTRQCSAHFSKVAVSEGPLLWQVDYLQDEDQIGKFHLLNIPALTQELGKQIHRSNAIYIRDCKIERIESSVEAEFQD